MRKTALFFILPMVFLIPKSGQAETFLLTNGDKITGSLIEKNAQYIIIDSPALGRVSLKKDFYQAPDQPEPEKKVKKWSGKINGGYSKQTGNTDTENLSGGFSIKRKVEKVNEFDVGGDSLYAASDKKMIAQKYSGMSRFAYSFGETKKWYNFYKIEGDHNRFSNIQARFTPSTGVGYWFSDTDDWKLMTELGVGVTWTDYRDDRKNESELVLIPRLFAEKRLIANARISEDLTVYPSLTNSGEYRLHSETVFTNPITDQFQLKLSWVNDYNSQPGAASKKHDMQLTTSLEYLF